ncbi:MAG: hypothetical protein NTX82_04490 [Candidatus Parcubacteria bacterium]|nr:hypothetical protein [Candidatus Parcubacteria bacterium]
MSVKQRIAAIQKLGTILAFSILSEMQRFFKPAEISYEIISKRMVLDANAVYLKIEDGKPVVCGTSMEIIQHFFRSFGFKDLPGKLPCYPHCVQCAGKCLANAA